MDFNLGADVKVEEEKDVIGGRVVLNTAVYPGLIDLCYLDASTGGAKNINIHFKTENGDVIRETVYISNKAGSFTYKDKDTGEPKPLPGYSQMDAFFKAVTGKGIAEQITEEKTISLYDKDANKELPVKRTVFMDVHKQPIAAGIYKVEEEKTTKESNYTQGTGEFYEKNAFDKWFDADTGLTAVEKAANKTEAEFLPKWMEKNEGKVRIIKAKKPGTPGSAASSGAPDAARPTTSLFGAKK